jgi:predicted alpha/beta-fold hydrolase
VLFSKISGHLHTLLGHFLPFAKLERAGTKFFVPLEDGDQLSGFLFEGTSNVVVSLFHGLSGDAEADYMQRTAARFLELGHGVFLVNHRGVGDGGAKLAKNLYHSGRGEDIGAVVRFLRQRMPGKKQITLGFSMSGNMVLALVSGLRGGDLPDGAIAVNAPINLAACAEALGRGFSRVYDLRFVRRLVAQRELAISPWVKLSDIDDAFTAPLSGFRDGRHYYEVCSTKAHVGKIEIPTEVITAADDPFIPVRDYLEAKWSAAVNLTIHPRGGHLGYARLRKNRFGNRHALDEHLVAALGRVLARVGE